jgi:hypothetical protein
MCRLGLLGSTSGKCGVEGSSISGFFSKEETFLFAGRNQERSLEMAAVTPESKIFDKADAAETRDQVLETLESIDRRMAHLEEQKKGIGSVELQRQISRELQRLQDLKAQLGEALDGEESPELEGE